MTPCIANDIDINIPSKSKWAIIHPSCR